jgi:hypothetical protein
MAALLSSPKSNSVSQGENNCNFSKFFRKNHQVLGKHPNTNNKNQITKN